MSDRDDTPAPRPTAAARDEMEAADAAEPASAHGNDDSGRSPAPSPSASPCPTVSRQDHYRRVSSPRLLDAIRKRLRSLGVRKQDLSDVAGDVLRELLETRTPPPSDEECLALALHVCEQRVTDRRRKHKRRSKANVGETDQADGHALDPRGHDSPEALLFEKQVCELLAEMFRDGSIRERSGEMWRLSQEGLSHVEIAHRMRCAPQTVANEVSAVRTKLRARFAALLAGGISVTAIVLWLTVPVVVAFVQREMHPPAERIERDLQGERPEPPQERADRLRRRAFDACRDGDWTGCEDDLDKAAQLDPAGDSRPDVQAARKQAHDALNPPPPPPPAPQPAPLRMEEKPPLPRHAPAPQHVPIK